MQKKTIRDAFEQNIRAGSGTAAAVDMESAKMQALQQMGADMGMASLYTDPQVMAQMAQMTTQQASANVLGQQRFMQVGLEATQMGTMDMIGRVGKAGIDDIAGGGGLISDEGAQSVRRREMADNMFLLVQLA